MNIKIIDSKLSNINSIKNMIEWIGYEATIIENLRNIKDGDRIILPGIGNFGEAMSYLQKNNIVHEIQDIAQKKNNLILGICLGMQLLMNNSEESPGIDGLGLIDGSVKKFSFSNKEYKIPHIGWNTLEIIENNSILNNIENKKSRYYFVHSYFVDCNNPKNVICKTNYGTSFDSVICQDKGLIMIFYINFQAKLLCHCLMVVGLIA